MPLFVLHCLDKPNSLELRMATRQAHLAYAGGFGGQMKLGGPMLNANGDMAGSLIIMEAADQAAVEAFSAGDPYTKAGLWERVDIKPFKATIGSL
jgi:uncharacterized protein